MIMKSEGKTMKFTKNKGMSLFIVSVALILFNIIAFMLPLEKSESFWTGYIAIILAVLITTIVGFYAFGHEEIKSRFYGMPLATVAWGYLIIQIIAGIIEMAVDAIPYRYGIIFNAFILGITLIGLIGIDVGKNEIERIEQKISQKVFYIKALQTDIEGLIVKSTDETTTKSLKELAETIRYCDPMSSPQLATIEEKIVFKIADLTNSVDTLDYSAIKPLCDEVQQLIAERNRKCKILK